MAHVTTYPPPRRHPSPRAVHPRTRARSRATAGCSAPTAIVIGRAGHATTARSATGAREPQSGRARHFGLEIAPRIGMSKPFEQWTVLPHDPLTPLGDDLWTVNGKIPMPL